MTMIRSGAALAVVLAATMGFARAEDSTTRPGVTGTVEWIDPGTRTVVLDGGRIYHMREDADVSILTKGASIALACDTAGANCVVITSGQPNDAIPDLQTNPSAGDTGEGGSSN